MNPLLQTAIGKIKNGTQEEAEQEIRRFFSGISPSFVVFVESEDYLAFIDAVDQYTAKSYADMQTEVAKANLSEENINKLRLRQANYEGYKKVISNMKNLRAVLHSNSPLKPNDKSIDKVK